MSLIRDTRSSGSFQLLKGVSDEEKVDDDDEGNGDVDQLRVIEKTGIIETIDTND